MTIVTLWTSEGRTDPVAALPNPSGARAQGETACFVTTEPQPSSN